MTDNQTTELAEAIQEVTEKASLLVREEIALAKAEMTEKVSGLAKGAAVGAAAGIFIVAGLIYFLHFIALLIAELLGANVVARLPDRRRAGCSWSAASRASWPRASSRRARRRPRRWRSRRPS